MRTGHLEHIRSEPVDAPRPSRVRGARKCLTWLALTHGVTCPSKSVSPHRVLADSSLRDKQQRLVEGRSQLFHFPRGGIARGTEAHSAGTVRDSVERAPGHGQTKPTHSASTEVPSRTRGGTRANRAEARRALLPPSALVVHSSSLWKETRLQQNSHAPEDDRHQQTSHVSFGGGFLSERSWFFAGWALLKTMANCCRDNVLPTPSAGYSGCVRRELGYDAASAVQTRILHTLRVSRALVF